MHKHKPTVLFISHGGGPLPLLGDEGHKEMVQNLKLMASKINKPSAILVISAHWEAQVPTITSASRPSLIYDYYGFPEESYDIQYPCPGEQGLAKQVQGVLGDKGIQASLDEQRGFDHGLFVPLKIMYPQADIPCIQLSLIKSLNPGEHIQLGAALANLEYDNLLILGSGFSFHNLRAFFVPATDDSQTKNAAFEQWLIDTCANPELAEAERAQQLENWETAPFARYCHPREEHLLPLHVCYGVAQAACKEYFTLTILNKKASVYLW